MAVSERATVLIVDDEPDVADAYAAQLRGQYDIQTVYSGEAALDALDPEIDVVLLDRRMPDISGDAILERIRERDLPARVAMVTAVDPDFDIIDMPFDDYVVKPVSRDDLFETIERLQSCAAYQNHLREYYALTSKFAALKASKREAELQSSDEFQELKDRIEDHQAELDEIVDRFDEHDYEAIFRDVGGRAELSLDE
ncbi:MULTISPECIES: HalX domain-containing protein [Halomicrobium]|uniref:Response regulator n=1 Tax=Halomicrobium mukohataei TaxID=57705 RepID=A0A847UEL3_9EURY|nr:MULTISPECIES: HalX domain-containing protein [Halomicrobium]NLV09874.1 response regulator [Halomicrobium mukohataei]QGA81804.1 Rec domain [Halomicrobium sp. LC1Hm]